MTDQGFWVLLGTMNLVLSDLAIGRGNYRSCMVYQGIAIVCLIISIVTMIWSTIHG